MRLRHLTFAALQENLRLRLTRIRESSLRPDLARAVRVIDFHLQENTNLKALKDKRNLKALKDKRFLKGKRG
jgi:hypothetical protein